MSQTPSLSTHLKFFFIGGLLAAVGLFGYSWLNQPEAASETAISEPAAAPQLAELPTATVYHNPSCGCCMGWVEHLEANGFDVERVEVDDVASERERLGAPDETASCHIAEIGDYVVEGHVPVSDVKTLLSEEPALAGIGIPGMPIGTPGMEQGDREDPYDVIGFDEEGELYLFRSHRP